MITRGHGGKHIQSTATQPRGLRLLPVVQAIALTLASGAAADNAGAAQPFSAGWYAAKGAMQETARTTGMVNGKPVSLINNPGAQQQQANAQLQQSIANLSMAARGIAMQQMAQAQQRRNLMDNAGTLPDGLGVNGLDTGSLASSWINANAPTQTTDANGNVIVGINQTADKAIANWESFNVGKNTIVEFNQASSNWAILNRIADALAPPSQIQGQIRAPGTVLIVNKNGIVFTGTSQINTRNLVAAAADITDNQFNTGGIYSSKPTTSYVPSFSNAGGTVTVEQGARITTNAPESVTQGGGYVLLMGRQVSNSGDIETPKGQIGMAAGDSFIIRKGVGTDANQSSTTRGNEISPQRNAGSTAGQVVNTDTGLLLAREGDITLAGHDVQQNGVAVATTDVNTRGTIHLLNSAGDAAGSVILGGKAITTIVTDDDGATALDSQRAALIADSAKQDQTRLGVAIGQFDNLSTQTDRQDQSRIEIVSGGNVQFADGSLTLATGGQIAVSAGNRSFAATGSILDVSGQVGVNLAMASNNVVVNVQGNELRDSPDNRDSGSLFNSNITVDRRHLILVPASADYPTDRWYTAGGLLEVSGYVNNQSHGIGEWAAQGGTVQLRGKEVVTQTGSQVNLSGGTLNVATGYVAQTWLVGSDGNLYNADNAPAGMTFNGMYKGFEVSHTRWGDDAAEFFYNPLIAPKQRLESGYTTGRDAGQLIVDAPTGLLEGSIVASVYNGPKQIRARDAVDGYLQAQTAVAQAGALVFGKYGPGGLTGQNDTAINIGKIDDITHGMTVDTALPTDRANTFWVDAGRLNAEALGVLNLASRDAITIDAPLQLTPGGQITLLAPMVDIAANITAASGSLVATNLFGTNPALISAGGQADVTLASGVTVDLRGQWTNGTLDPDHLTGLAYINGGKLNFDSSGSVILSAGSVIDASSGAAILASGKTIGGKGGDVTLIAGDPVGGGARVDAGLTLDGTIRAIGVTGGGKLAISSPNAVVLGVAASIENGTLNAGTPAPSDLALAQALTVPAGQALPISARVTYTEVSFGVPTLAVITTGEEVPSGPTGADWNDLPDGFFLWAIPPGSTFSTQYRPGSNLPRGAIITTWSGSTIPVGTIIPTGVFPNGMPIQPYTVSYIKGQVLPTATVFPAGTRVPAGSTFSDSVAIQAPRTLDPSLFQSGFASYDINSNSSILVTEGTHIVPLMPVYQFLPESRSLATGSDPSVALQAWLPPLYSENPAGAVLTQRGGASLALRSVIKDPFGPLTDGGPIEVEHNAAITVDPGQAITLQGFGQITIDGSLVAHGGSISISNTANGSSDAARNFDSAGNARGRTLWIGDDALLDVSGQAVQAVDARGRVDGRAGNGGTITLDGSTSFLIVRPGAQLNADGAAAAVALPDGTTTALAGNGGAVGFSSASGMYLDGNFHAFGAGPGAAGGSLSVSLSTPFYTFGAGENVPASRMVPSVLTIAQPHALMLPDDIAPGTDANAMAFGQATIGADQVASGGFGALSLTSGDYIRFAGDVRLSLAQSFKMNASAYTAGLTVPNTSLPSTPPGSGSVVISAPYVLLQANPANISDGQTTGGLHNPGVSNAPTTASFEIDADQLDIQGQLAFSLGASLYTAAAQSRVFVSAPGFHNVNLISQGDIRFLQIPNSDPAKILTTTLFTPWDLSLQAAQIYPAMGVKALVVAGIGNLNYDATLTLGRTTDAIPDAPMSAFGNLQLVASIIEQGGVVRAPFGKITLGNEDVNNSLPGGVMTEHLNLLPGSVTSVSMAGMTIPYGGTVDGVSYTYNGTVVNGPGLTTFDINKVPVVGINLDASTIQVQSDATLDLTGGGVLAGAGFISGRGGSVNVLKTPLINANPATPVSRATDKVYAIVPGYVADYAPIVVENGAGDPVAGQQVTIGAGVPGLQAGTYTLLPSTYALLPGAFRVEIGQALPPASLATSALGNGSFVTAGTLSIANTSARNSTPSTLLVTPASAVRTYSQFDEQSFGDFLRARATQFGSVRPLLPEDGKTLLLSFETPTVPGSPALTFNGKALLGSAAGGFAGQVVVDGAGDIYADAPTPGYAGASVSAAAINAIGAPRLSLGGYMAAGFDTQSSQLLLDTFGGDVNLRDGVSLKAGEIFLVGNNIQVGRNVSLSTIGQGDAPFDSVSTGMSYVANGDTVLALSNGELHFLGATATGRGAITLGAGSSLYSEGTLTFATNGSANLDPAAHFGARNISLAVGNLNIGSTADQAAGNAPPGMAFNQALFDALLHGDAQHGAPALEQLTLSATAINLFGTTSLDARGSGVDLVLVTPTMYGVGAAGDRATIAADRIEWNSIAGQTPPAITAGGPGTGSGSLVLVADEIDLGQFAHLDSAVTSRVTYGFANVNLNASERITAAGTTTLYVYQAASSTAGDVFGKSGTGGNLTLRTPLLSGVQKSIAGYTAGGVLSVVAPDGVAPSMADTSVAGAEIDLSGNSVNIGSTILLPSGKLAVKAVNDINLQDGSRIDLSGQPTVIQRATVYGFGGIVSFDSAQGSITQTAGSVIDVSATQANAGSITATATNGHVALGGGLQGSADSGLTSGDVTVTAATIDDFDGLNARLTQGGVFDARSFDVKRGSLTIGDGVKAHNVTVAVDNGDLTVTGKIDAGGAAPGTIRLSAQGDLTLAATSTLDAHGDVLQVDSYGQSIAAKNRGHIELNTAAGTLRLNPGATMDLLTPDGVAYGDVQLNAPRTAETSGDIAIEAGGPLNIHGAYAVALNAMWTYDLPGGSVITQATLDGYDNQNLAFINAAYGSNVNAGLLTTNLQGKLAGLLAQGDAFHLRPGVQITSSGDLSTSGDIDLSRYRYGPNANRDLTSAFYGAGEPMALTVRAAGDLTIKGSISDGFGPGLAGSPAIYSGIIPDLRTVFSFDSDGSYWLGDGIPAYYIESDTYYYIVNDWVMPNNTFYNDLKNGLGSISDANGVAHEPGSTVPAGTIFQGWNIAFDASGNLPALATGVESPGTPAAGPTSPRSVMLPTGSLSASLRLVAGADTGGADPRALQAIAALQGKGNLSLNNPNFNTSLTGTYLSVLRTGTGSLDLLAGGNFSEATPFGVYTAGTQSAAVLAADGSNPYDLPGRTGPSHAWYPEQGGDLLISAQGDVSGNIQMFSNNQRFVDADLISNWLWMQGGAGVTADPGAWFINFGTNAQTNGGVAAPDQSFLGFQGIGTLGGGNLTMIAGRNAGTLNTGASTGLNLVVGSTGRVLADGSLLQTGGGDLVVKVGGTLNPFPPSAAANQVSDYFGLVADLRGDTTINAGAIGALAVSPNNRAWTSVDPRTPDADTFKHAYQTPGPVVAPGDGTVRITARGDLVLGGAADAGMVYPGKTDGMPYTQVNASGGTTFMDHDGQTHFTLWRPGTAINLYSAGGDVAALTGGDANNTFQNANGFYPGTLIVAAANGDIRMSEPVSANAGGLPLELVPAPQGQLALLAAGTIYGSGRTVAMSGADLSGLATPFQPLFLYANATKSNASPAAANRVNFYNPLGFGEDTPVSNLHTHDTQPALIYAGTDIDDLIVGMIERPNTIIDFVAEHTTWYVAAKPFDIIAGRDLVGAGSVPGVFVNNTTTDITSLQAGRDILYQSATVAGPGLMQMQAGRNLYQGYYGSLESVGQLYGVNSASRAGGADIAVMAGVGADGPDYVDFAKTYLDAANQADTSAAHPLADQPGKVARTYDQELLAWLQQRFGYTGAPQDALAYFLALPSAQQGVLVRQVYYAELKAGGREFNDPDSTRFQSYLRGRQAIATLFPTTDAQGNAIRYDGQLTMFSSVTGTKNVGGVTVPVVTDAGIHTDFGGAIQILNPGGQTLIGVEGVAPDVGAGLITQGEGDIDIYSAGSILLGQSRIMTTFGGDILAWSADGDINAGRGSKTTILFTPPRRVYDELGDVTLSPQVPSTGAGIATLNPIPEVAAGDVDLIAPLGTIDAGEAGIRVSGNVNLAALQVVNAANIQAQGKSTGLPLVASVNVSALTNASAAATQAVMAAQDVVSRERTAARQALPSIFTVRVLGFGNDPAAGTGDAASPRTDLQSDTGGYDWNSRVQVVGHGRHLRPELVTRMTADEQRVVQQDR